ncbi:MAG: hypothetical protein SF066_06860 [Thermoanaerobaculia bacterium]|nr:hypothetical protein [Thermoanaerobaculia bacterium]
MEITVHRLAAHYRLPASRLGERARLDRLLPEVFEAALERALDGFDPDREVVIRELRVPVALRLGGGDHRLLVAWADAVSAAVKAALPGSDTPSDPERVVVFRNRRQALVAFARDVASGETRRLWAFRRLGFVTGTAEDSVALALELARAFAAAPETLVPVLEELGREGLLPRLVAQFAPEWWPELAARALVVLGKAEAIPLLEPGTGGKPRTVRRHRGHGRSPLGRCGVRALVVLAAAVEGRVDWVDGVDMDDVDEMDAVDRGEGAGAVGVSEVHSVHDVHSVHSVHFSELGGLLFLLPLVEPASLPVERPLRWSLQQLALALVPAESGDPAVLAFCGLGPEAVPPDRDEPPVTEEEAAVFAELAAGLVATLALRLGEPEPSRALLERVVRRRARVVADPGWLELHFSLDDVSTELRRVGLDLDPGFLPWLGVVVRFVYE